MGFVLLEYVTSADDINIKKLRITIFKRKLINYLFHIYSYFEAWTEKANEKQKQNR